MTFDLAEVTAGFSCAFADKAEAPVDEVGVSELEDHRRRRCVPRCVGPWGRSPATQTRGISPLVQRNFVGTPSRFDGFTGVQAAEDADEIPRDFRA